jgi:hypothetical protein
MLARRSAFRHPTAGAVELPLLVPAFSSKGFAFRSRRAGKAPQKYSEVAYELAEFGKQPHKSVLVSAYDLFHRHFHAPKVLPSVRDAYLDQSAVIFLGSGGYELAPEFDSTEPRIFTHRPERFSEAQYRSILNQMRDRRIPPPLVISNFDFRRTKLSLSEQIKKARALFRAYPSFASDFIIKPWKGAHLDPADLSDRDVANLRGFDVIGVTEKDLARDLIDRLSRVAMLRRRLDAQGISAPIHVWGGLEPIATPLFFFAGAEIVDGISWLRYAYRDGLAVSRDSYCVVSQTGVTATSVLNHMHASLDNLVALSRLTISLQRWVDGAGKDFSMFPPEVQGSLQNAYSTMCSCIPALNGRV